MSRAEQWIHRPQNVWLRKALFQIHLWTGIIAGFYIVAICLSGSALVFRPELLRSLWTGPRTVAVSGQKLSQDELKQAAVRAHPNHTVLQVSENKPDQATDILLSNSNDEQIQREFDPYTGRDLGPTTPLSYATLNWLAQFHSDLQAGSVGRALNGAGGLCLALLSITGIVIWWPGIQSWKRSLTVGWRGSWKQFNWGVHSAVGFYALVLVFMWGLTGAYLIFPKPFEIAVNHFSPLASYQTISPTAPVLPVGSVPEYKLGTWQRRLYGRRQIDSGEKLIRWFTLAHFGRFAGTNTRILWVVLGLVPPLLFVTGALMWWNRVLHPYFLRLRLAAPERSKETAAASN